MNARAPFAIAAAGILAMASLHAAEKMKRSEVADYPFWTAKKRGAMPQFVPGLTAVLALTDSQRQAIAAARDEMSGDEAVQAARKISKNDPSVTPEQREKARATLEAATARLQDRVTAILTPEQKALIGKINDAYAAAVEETGIVYEDKFASVKADQVARRRIQDEKTQDTEELFFHKLDGLLTGEQREAMSRAAKEEEQRHAAAAGAKKAVK